MVLEVVVTGLVVPCLLDELDVAPPPAIELMVPEEGVLADKQEDHVVDVVYQQPHYQDHRVEALLEGGGERLEEIEEVADDCHHADEAEDGQTDRSMGMG